MGALPAHAGVQGNPFAHKNYSSACACEGEVRGAYTLNTTITLYDIASKHYYLVPGKIYQ